MKTLLLIPLLWMTRLDVCMKFHATYNGKQVDSYAFATAPFFDIKNGRDSLRLLFKDTLGESRVYKIDTLKKKK